MGVEPVFVRTKRLHVGVDAFARAETEATEGLALPFWPADAPLHVAVCSGRVFTLTCTAFSWPERLS